MGSFFQGEVPKEAAINPDVVDSIIAAELSKLSVEDREKAYLDIHGVSQPKDESPDLIQSSLMEMETAMKELANREAYDLAKSMDPHYVMNDEFRLKFLRADLFNAKKAAIRLCRHFQLKMDLFGADKLALDITQDDLGKEEMDVLYSGYGRILPQHDQTGRLVNVLIANPDHPTEAILRRAFYTATTVQSEDSEAQRRGTVTIAYYLGHGPTSGFNSDISWKMPKMNEGLPMRVVAIHMCYDTGAWTPVHSVVKLAFNTFAKVRIRMHYGSHKECLASLQRHGIKPSIIPISDNGKPADLDSFQQSLRRQRKRERVNKPKRLKIFVPSEYDVLLGRGTPIQNFIGNKRLRSLVLDFQKQYEKAPKGIKIAIAQEIVHLVYQASGMFLKRDGETWITANHDTAKDKVSALFRTNRLQQK